jgi:hypothetical protein
MAQPDLDGDKRRRPQQAGDNRQQRGGQNTIPEHKNLAGHCFVDSPYLDRGRRIWQQGMDRSGLNFLLTRTGVSDY